MRRAARHRPVIPVVPATRAWAIVTTLVALLTFAVTIVLAKDRLLVLITSVPMALLWSVGMILLLPTMMNHVPPPIRVRPDQLPRSVPLWKAIVPGVTLLAIFGIAAAGFSLSVHEYLAVGVVLGAPIVVWDSVRRARRTEQELSGALWSSTGFAVTSNDRIRYLVTSTS
jgi:hypothetical protein